MKKRGWKRDLRGNGDWRNGGLEGLMYYFGGVVLGWLEMGWKEGGRDVVGGLVPKVVRSAIFVLRRIICDDVKSSLVFCRL